MWGWFRMREMREEVVGDLPRAWPFYLVCDVSQSMWKEEWHDGDYTPWEVMRDGLTGFVDEIEYYPTARDTCHLSIIAFGEEVETLLPLTPFLSPDLSFPTLPKMGLTDYEKVFAHLADVIESDTRRLAGHYNLYRPAVYFVTDGKAQDAVGEQPESRWLPHVRRLHTHPSNPIVVSLGLGTAEVGALRQIAAAPGPACIAQPDALPSDLLKAIIKSIISSVANSAGKDGFVFDVPPGMRPV